MKDASLLHIKIIMGLVLCLSLISWAATRSMQTKWNNVPPAPSYFKASSMGLGDNQLTYRMIGTTLQNFGNTGGRFMPLKDYNYDRLGDWLNLQYALDPKSNFTPNLAAYYFSSAQNPDMLRPIINYLGAAGDSAEDGKWRWLAQAVYLSRFKLKDYDLALTLAYKLAAIPNPKMPVWARQLPANVLNDKGEKEAALEMIQQIIESSGASMHPNEINALNDYMCMQILDEKDAALHSFCDDVSQ